MSESIIWPKEFKTEHTGSSGWNVDSFGIKITSPKHYKIDRLVLNLLIVEVIHLLCLVFL